MSRIRNTLATVFLCQILACQAVVAKPWGPRPGQPNNLNTPGLSGQQPQMGGPPEGRPNRNRRPPEQAGPAGPGRNQGQQFRQRLTDFDLDGDGRLSSKEREHAINSLMGNQRLRQRLDRNGDGQIDAAEEAVFRERLQKAFDNASKPGHRRPKQRP